MKNLLIKSSSFVALAVAASISVSAHAGESKWYVGVSANQADLDTIDTTATNIVPGETAARTLDLGSDVETGFGIKAGYNLITQENGNTFSLELSYSDTDHDINNITFNGARFSGSDNLAEGSLEVETILLRGVYTFDLGAFKPYFGVGIGETDLDVDARYGMNAVGTAPQSQPPFATGSDSAFALEFRGGVELAITKQLGVFLEYSLTEVDDIDFTRLGGGQPAGLALTTQESDLDFESINLGLNFHF